MEKAIIGKKIGMTQIFENNGLVTPVTVIEAGPCVVVQVKTMENDGYEAIQVGFEDKREKLVNQPMKGHFDTVTPKRNIKEFKLNGSANYTVGDEIKAGMFEAEDRVDVTGVSKGKGFQGIIKRHNMTIGRMSHGSKHHRTPGALAGSADPGKVRKGKKLPGHMGYEQKTVQNLRVVRVDEERNLILIKGAVPGPKGSIVYLKSTVKN